MGTVAASSFGRNAFEGYLSIFHERSLRLNIEVSLREIADHPAERSDDSINPAHLASVTLLHVISYEYDHAPGDS